MGTGALPPTEIRQDVGLPLSLTARPTVIEFVAPDRLVMVTVGGAIVRALAVVAGPVPAALTALTLTVTVSPSPKPLSSTAVAVTVCSRPPADTTYPVMGRPLSAAARQVARTVPGLSTVEATSCRTAPGLVNGTTVLLVGDGCVPAPLSLTATTVKAYCVP